MDNRPQESLVFMLGEMRADLKYLVNERRKTSERLDELEDAQAIVNMAHDARLSKLEHFKTRIGVITTILSVSVPSAITVFIHKAGLL